MSTTLIIEDNETFRSSLRSLLCSRFPDMHVEEAADCGEGLRKTLALFPDIIFVDLRLPGSGGLELTRRIKEGNGPSVVIVLTSYDLPEYRNAALLSGADFFCTKGNTSSDEITAMVRSVLEQSGIHN